VPISALAMALTAARTALALAERRLPSRLAAWSILRSRHYDGRLAAALLAAADREDPDAATPATETRLPLPRRAGSPVSIGEPA
jgi:hypothetical protein